MNILIPNAINHTKFKMPCYSLKTPLHINYYVIDTALINKKI